MSLTNEEKLISELIDLISPHAAVLRIDGAAMAFIMIKMLEGAQGERFLSLIQELKIKLEKT